MFQSPRLQAVRRPLPAGVHRLSDVLTQVLDQRGIQRPASPPAAAPVLLIPLRPIASPLALMGS